MVKDRRYIVVRSDCLKEVWDIKKFMDIFEYLPQSILIRDLRQNYSNVFQSKITV